jgi:hypothetical protein
MEQKQMDETDRDGHSTLRRRLSIVALSVVLCFLVLSLVHYVSSELKDANGLDLTNGVAIAFLLLALGCTWLLVRQIRTPTGEAPPTSQERLNRNLLVASGLIGAVVAIAMSFVEGADMGLLSNAPLPPVAAILLILVTGVLAPAISVYWQWIIDEQEADATKTGALFGIYTYGIGAPVWWLAWRGGFVSPPDGFTIYFVTMMVVSAVWLWKKYL